MHHNSPLCSPCVQIVAEAIAKNGDLQRSGMLCALSIAGNSLGEDGTTAIVNQLQVRESSERACPSPDQLYP